MYRWLWATEFYGDSDLQHSKDLTSTDDALMGITWRMKKRSVQVPWAALRIGVSGRDWGVDVA